MELIQGLIILSVATAVGFLFTHRVISKIVVIGILDILVAGIILCIGLKVAAFVYLVVSLFIISMVFTLGTKVINMSHTERCRSGLISKLVFSGVFIAIEIGLIVVLTHSNADFSSFGNFDVFRDLDYAMNKSMIFVYSLIAIAASLVVFICSELFKKREIEC